MSDEDLAQQPSDEPVPPLPQPPPDPDWIKQEKVRGSEVPELFSHQPDHDGEAAAD